MNLDDIKKQYPEIANITVTDVINSDSFNMQYEKALKAYKPVSTYFYAYKSLEKDGVLKAKNFKKEYLACIDKESKLPFAKRVVIYSIGNDAYSRAIKKMMKDYDKNKNS